MSQATIEAAKVISIANFEKYRAPKQSGVEAEQSAVKAAKKIGRTIDRMSQVCYAGKRQIAMLLNTLILELNVSDKIAKIEEDYINSGSSTSGGYHNNISNAKFTFEKFSVLVPKITGMGVAKDQPLLFITDYKFLKASAKTGDRDRHYDETNYRMATAEEIEKFYNALSANYAIEGKLPVAFVLPEQ